MTWRCRDQEGYNTRKIIQAVENGELEEEILDRTVERILKVVFSYTDNRKAETVFDREKDHKAAADIETECAVLLENKGSAAAEKRTESSLYRGICKETAIPGRGIESHQYGQRSVGSGNCGEKRQGSGVREGLLVRA